MAVRPKHAPSSCCTFVCVCVRPSVLIFVPSYGKEEMSFLVSQTQSPDHVTLFSHLSPSFWFLLYPQTIRGIPIWEDFICSHGLLWESRYFFLFVYFSNFLLPCLKLLRSSLFPVPLFNLWSHFFLTFWTLFKTHLPGHLCSFGILPLTFLKTFLLPFLNVILSLPFGPSAPLPASSTPQEGSSPFKALGNPLQVDDFQKRVSGGDLSPKLPTGHFHV